MVGNVEYIKLGITIITSILSVLGVYHKFIMKRIEVLSEDIKIVKEHVLNSR